MTMKIVVFGLSLSSSWGNGHATTYRALLGALADRGHDIVFLERNRPWYARHRDLKEPDYCRLTFYDELSELEDFAPLVAGADVVIVGSYVPDGVEVAEWVQRTAGGTVAFYDIDTPVTLARLRAGDCEYLTPGLIPHFDLYLSFTGGPTLRFIEEVYGAPAARVLHCSVDEARYRETPAARRWHLGYLGTYSDDRQPTLERLLIEPARQAPDLRFVVAGPQYPADIDWPKNVERIEHLPPSAHPQFYSSLCWALNVTRADMIAAGHSPSVRLFEAGACGAPIISDEWPGLDELFEPSSEIVVARSSDDVLSALRWSEDDRLQLAAAGRRRVLAQHTARHRAEELEALVAEVAPARAAPGIGAPARSPRRAAFPTRDPPPPPSLISLPPGTGRPRGCCPGLGDKRRRQSTSRDGRMARQDQKTSDRHREDTRPDPQSGDWFSGERENEFGGEGRFRAEGAAHGSHFGGEPEALRDSRHPRDARAWLGERRRRLMEKFDRWRSERAAPAAPRGPDSASDGTPRRETGRSAKK